MEENGDPQRESSISLLDDENRDVPAVGLLVPPGVVGSAWCRGTSSATGRPRAVVPEDFCSYARVTRCRHLTPPLAGSVTYRNKHLSDRHGCLRCRTSSQQTLQKGDPVRRLWERVAPLEQIVVGAGYWSKNLQQGAQPARVGTRVAWGRPFPNLSQMPGIAQ